MTERMKTISGTFTYVMKLSYTLGGWKECVHFKFKQIGNHPPPISETSAKIRRAVKSKFPHNQCHDCTLTAEGAGGCKAGKRGHPLFFSHNPALQAEVELGLAEAAAAPSKRGFARTILAPAFFAARKEEGCPVASDRKLPWVL